MESESHKHTAQCEEIFARLSEYLDAELPVADCDHIKAHIEGCTPCVEFLESLKRSIALCRDFETRTTPAPLKAEVRENLLAAYRRMLAARGERP